jgi:hypothetical protein
MKKTKQTYVLPLLEECHSIISSFNLSMSKGADDVFALIIIFLGSKWKPKHGTFDLFQGYKT